MSISNFYLYPPEKGPVELPDFAIPASEEEIYLPSPELAAAVNVALALGQPLLLTGEPGTGKTRLAYHIAQSFGLKGPFVFNAQTSSVKKDLFYTYDALGHFQWAQNPANDRLTSLKQLEDKYFIRYEALGKAIQLANECEGKANGKRSVVLIDEIDKAPRDLPNDLLAAIEDLSFEVAEMPGDQSRQWKCPAHLRPVIIITSNSEKDLPAAFLRRVVYHHIKFPDEKKLLEILQAKGLTGLKNNDLDALIQHFLDIRKKGLGKNPATAELIAWANLLPKLQFPVQKLKDVSKLTEEAQKLLHISYGVLAKSKEDLERLTTL